MQLEDQTVTGKGFEFRLDEILIARQIRGCSGTGG